MMKIAVAADAAGMTGMISSRLSEAKALLIIGMDDNPESAEIIKSMSNSSVASMAEAAVAENCEAIISGGLEMEAFIILADAQVTRYNGAGMTVIEGLRKMQDKSLGCFTRHENEPNDGQHTCGHEDGD